LIRKIAFFLILANLAFSQTEKKFFNFIELNTFIENDSLIEYLSYKIPYNILLFTKDNNNYKSEFTLSLEIYKDKIFFKREINKYEVKTANYKKTKSDKDYYQDFIRLNLPEGNFQFDFYLNLRKTDYNIKLPALKLKVTDIKKQKFLKPIIVNNNTAKTDNFILTNSQNNIPFTPEKYNLLLGIPDTSVKIITVSITQNQKKIFQKKITQKFSGGIKLYKSENKLLIKHTNNSESNYFLITNFSNRLYEGNAKLHIKYDTLKKTFPLKTTWFDKPEVLKNPEYAIKLLSYMENIQTVRSLLENSNKYYYKKLFEYWENKFPVKNKKFNFAMKEYYTRADYANKNFSKLNDKKGAQSDRGKIYIVYGKPDSMKRNYNEKNETIEIWQYKKINKKFVFKDVTGTGKFILVK